jgi:hypothetical protein
MLAVTGYSKEYIDGCRSRVAAEVAAYRGAIAAARAGSADGAGPAAGALDAFEHAFFNNLVLTLDYLFVHRLRAKEGKDGNPLNEVRVLSASMLLNGGRLAADKTVKLAPATSVLRHRVGDEIRLTEADFIRLSTAFFEDIERKFS